MIDNSDIQTKIRIRQKGLLLLQQEPLSVLEMFAGEGVITYTLWLKVSNNITCIEKERGKFNIKHEKITLIEANNKDFEDFKNYNVIDLDSYGMVFKLLEKVSENCKPNTVIFFTEFNPFGQNKYDWQSKFINKLNELNSIAYYVCKSRYSAAIYGFIYV